MKKYSIFIIISLLLAACKYKEEVTFDQKASDRTVATLNNYKQTIEAHDGYWLLTVYPEVYRAGYWVYPFYPEVYTTDREFPRAHRSIGGYNFVVKLKDGKVTASSEINNNNEDESYFTYSVTEGPTISFDTYNSVLHHFRFVSAVFPNARGGEIEYIIEKEENGVFTLRGRTNNNIATLSRLEGDREAYLNKVRENGNALKNKGLSPISVNGTSVDLYLFPSYRQLTFMYGDHQQQQQAFITTERGIKLYEPVTINGVTFSEFYLNDDKTALVTPDGSISSNFVVSPYIPDTARKITMEEYYVSDALLSLYNRNNVSVNNYRRGSNHIYYSLDTGIYLSSLSDGNDDSNTEGMQAWVQYTSEDGNQTAWFGTFYEMDFVGVAGQPNQVQILFKDARQRGNNIQFFRNLEDYMTQIAKYSPYEISYYSGEYDRFTSVKNPDIWFFLQRQ